MFDNNSLNESLYSFERKVTSGNKAHNSIKNKKIINWKNRNNLNDIEFSERLKVSGMNEYDFKQILQYGTGEYSFASDINKIINNFLEEKNEFEFVSGLGEFLLPFLNYYKYKMGIILKKYNNIFYDRKDMVNILTQNLYYHLKKISDKTMVLEFQKKLKEDGKPLMEKFKKDYLKKRDYHYYLLNKYPVLYRVIYETVTQDLKNSHQFINRLSTDLKYIQKEFMGGKDLKLVNITKGAGDRHNGGQSVIICDFENHNRVIYKPRSLEVDMAFSEFIKMLNKNGNLIYKLDYIKSINQGNYGWQEYIYSKECKNKKEVEQTYYRLGLLISLMHIFKTNDMHYENIIISGMHPYIVDLETFITNNSIETKDQSTPLTKLYTSIYKTGMLPTGNLFPSYIDNDISGLTSVPYQKSNTIKHWHIIDDDTDNVHLEHKAFITSGTNHLVKLKGDIIKSYNYLNNILDGFDDMYNCVLENKEKVEFYIDSKFNHCYGRSIFRSTYIYGKFLTTSYHPDYLSNGIDREYLFELLWNQYKKSKKYLYLIKQEIISLLNNDIPYCSFKTNSKSLFINNIEIPDFFKDTSLNIIKSQIQQMDSDDLELQKRFIYNSLNDFELKNYDFNHVEEKVTDTDLKIDTKDLSKHIANSIIQNNYLSSIDNSSGMWIGSELSSRNNTYRLSVLDFSLYSGVCGIVIFLAEMYKKTKHGCYLEICKKSVSHIIHNSNKLTLSPSMYNGLGSISYTFFYLYEITADTYYKFQGEKYFNEMINKIQSDDIEFDLLDGLAGNIIFCVELYEKYNDNIYLNYAYNLAILLKGKLRDEKDKLLTGLGHGTSGIALAFNRISEYYIDFKTNVEEMMEYENSNYNESIFNWKDLRKKINTDNFNVNYWCHGRPGILLSKAIIYEGNFINDSKNINYKEIYDISYKQTKLMKRISLCHGIFGNLEIFKMIADKIDSSYSRREIQKYKEKVLKEDDNKVQRQIKSMLNNNLIGLMTGVSGIGLSLIQSEEDTANPLLLKLP